MKKYADFKVYVTVQFDDNGEDDLKDQAFDALKDKHGLNYEAQGYEAHIVGAVRDTELPA